MKIKIDILTAVKIKQSKKTFFCFNLKNHENKLDNYTLTNDLTRHRHKFQYFKLVENMKLKHNYLKF